MVRQGRDFLQTEFRKRNLEYVPSVANFILVKVGKGKEVFQKLLKRGMIVRAMDEYKLPEWIRVTVGTPEQNRRFFGGSGGGFNHRFHRFHRLGFWFGR